MPNKSLKSSQKDRKLLKSFQVLYHSSKFSIKSFHKLKVTTVCPKKWQQLPQAPKLTTLSQHSQQNPHLSFSNAVLRYIKFIPYPFHSLVAQKATTTSNPDTS